MLHCVCSLLSCWSLPKSGSSSLTSFSSWWAASFPASIGSEPQSEKEEEEEDLVVAVGTIVWQLQVNVEEDWLGHQELNNGGSDETFTHNGPSTNEPTTSESRKHCWCSGHLKLLGYDHLLKTVFLNMDSPYGFSKRLKTFQIFIVSMLF